MIDHTYQTAEDIENKAEHNLIYKHVKYENKNKDGKRINFSRHGNSYKIILSSWNEYLYICDAKNNFHTHWK